MKKDAIIAKQKELIKILINHPEPQNMFDSMKEKASISKIQSELSALESEPDKEEDDKRKDYIRKQAISVKELTKGFSTTPVDNAMKTLLEFTDYILELTNDIEKESEEICPVCKTSYLYNGECLNYSCSAYAYRPITNKEAEERKTAEEYLKIQLEVDKLPVHRLFIDSSLVTKWLVDFASQSLPEISDEEITARAVFLSTANDGGVNLLTERACISIAKWLRDEMKRRLK